jgi:hypothetical protein
MSTSSLCSVTGSPEVHLVAKSRYTSGDEFSASKLRLSAAYITSPSSLLLPASSIYQSVLHKRSKKQSMDCFSSKSETFIQYGGAFPLIVAHGLLLAPRKIRLHSKHDNPRTDALFLL